MPGRVVAFEREKELDDEVLAEQAANSTSQ
jgi:hypothetical protein